MNKLSKLTIHWRTELDIWGGGGGGKPKSAYRGETGGMLHREIKKNTCRIFLMPFPAFLSRFMQRAGDKWKENSY